MYFVCAGCRFNYACLGHSWASFFHLKRGNCYLFPDITCLVCLIRCTRYICLRYLLFIPDFCLIGCILGCICTKSGRQVLFVRTNRSFSCRMWRKTEEEKGRAWWEGRGVRYRTSKTLSGELGSCKNFYDIVYRGLFWFVFVILFITTLNCESLNCELWILIFCKIESSSSLQGLKF